MVKLWFLAAAPVQYITCTALGCQYIYKGGTNTLKIFAMKELGK